MWKLVVLWMKSWLLLSVLHAGPPEPGGASSAEISSRADARSAGRSRRTRRRVSVPSHGASLRKAAGSFSGAAIAYARYRCARDLSTWPARSARSIRSGVAGFACASAGAASSSRAADSVQTSIRTDTRG